MNPHRVLLELGPGDAAPRVFLDGAELRNVVGVTIVAGSGKQTRVTLTLRASVVVQGDEEIDVETRELAKSERKRQRAPTA
jgi:hypothetical protein